MSRGLLVVSMSTHHSVDRLTMATLPSEIPIQTVVHTYTGEEDGPRVYIQAAQHGREVNGVETVRRLHDRLINAEISGTVLVIPIANPITFDRVSYTSPAELDSVNPNMNRVWPGNDSGTIHEQMAAKLWDEASQADAIIDLHTGSPDMYPHVIVTQGDNRSMELARSFGTDLLLAEPAHDDADEEWGKRNFEGKLRVAAYDAGIPCITPELSYNRQIVESAVELGVRGSLNVLRELAMLETELEPNGTPTVCRNHLGRVIAGKSGFFHPDPDLAVGERVTEGTYLGTVYDPMTFDEKEIVTADRSGILYVLAREATVVKGDTLANVALPLSD